MMNQSKNHISDKSMLYYLIAKDLNSKYHASILGMFWHILSPLGMLALYYFVFGSIFYPNDADYWVYLSVGIFPFFFFQSVLSEGSMSIIWESETLKKKKFPRIYIVLAKIIALFIIFIISYCVMFIIFLIAKVNIEWTSMLFLPLLMGLSFIFAMGIGLIFSILTIYVRDVQHIIDTFSRVFYWITPLFFYMSSVPDSFVHDVIMANPFTYFIESYHSVIFYGMIPNLEYICGCVFLSSVVIVFGYMLFKKYEKIMVEEL